MVTGTLGRSYVAFRLTWDERADEPARVWVRMNVINFEVVVEQRLRWPVPLADGTVLARLSFRQKLREHFLASPFLKRYHAEDAAILVGVLFREMAENRLLPMAHLSEEG